MLEALNLDRKYWQIILSGQVYEAIKAAHTSPDLYLTKYHTASKTYPLRYCCMKVATALQ
jgi:hypothetical protein